MLILSKFHDYYDSAIGYGGVDKSIVYKRKEKLIKYPKSNFTKIYNKYFNFFNNLDIQLITRPHEFNYSYHGIILIICGKIYSCVRLNLKNNTKYICFYNFENMKECMKDNFSKKEYENFIEKSNKQSYFQNYNLKNFFDIPKNISLTELQIIDYHRKINSPIIQYGSHHSRALNIKLNPKLK